LRLINYSRGQSRDENIVVAAIVEFSHSHRNGNIVNSNVRDVKSFTNYLHKRDFNHSWFYCLTQWDVFVRMVVRMENPYSEFKEKSFKLLSTVEFGIGERDIPILGHIRCRCLNWTMEKI
jgi:hypothetical protein